MCVTIGRRQPDGGGEMSGDGSRLVYHTTGAGDPTFVRDPRQDSKDRPIFTAAAGLHAHFPIWSSNQAFIYFVLGEIPGAIIREADRVPVLVLNARKLSSGGEDEARLVFSGERERAVWIFRERAEYTSLRRVG